MNSKNRTRIIKNTLLLLGLACGLVILILPPPEGLTPQGMRCLGVAVICFSLWVLQFIPLAATSLLAIVLLPAFNILGRTQVFSFFGNSAVFFLLGVFILSGAIIHTGLSKRLAFIFIQGFGRSPKGLLFGVTFTSSLFALFMPCHAVAAMMFPVVLELTTALRLEKGRSNLGKSLFLALAWGSVVGGIGTYLGGARVPLAVEFLREAYGRNVDFMTWAAAATPIAAVLTVLVYFVIARFFPSERKDVTAAKDLFSVELKRIRHMSANEIKTAFVAGIAILLWIFGGHNIGLAIVSIAAAVAVFVFRIARWNDVSDYINWGIIVMYGGAIALGKSLYETKAIEWVVAHTLGSAALSPFLLIVILSALSTLITEAISNAAAVVIMVPLSFGFVAQTGLSPELLTLAVTIPAGLAFCLPVGSPPNAIAFASGYFKVKDMFLPGLIFKFIAWAVFLLAVKFFWPLLNFGF
jgi:sodium-dependent dicarboxylate transporter 2/3/5